MGHSNIEVHRLFDAYMDKECLRLCDALNDIPGITTQESCCGHGSRNFNIWFCLDKKYFENLHIIARIVCSRYGGYSNWSCNICCNDRHQKNMLTFVLSSGKVKGSKAYKQANKMGTNIYRHLHNKNYKNEFKIISKEK